MKSIRKDRWILNSLNITLLSAYYIFLSFPLFHSLSHFVEGDIQHIECSVENENNSCHQFVYHNNEEVNCGHKDHVIELIDDCDLCAVRATPSTQLDYIAESDKNFVYNENELSYHQEFIFSFDFLNEDVRGPPNTFI